MGLVYQGLLLIHKAWQWRDGAIEPYGLWSASRIKRTNTVQKLVMHACYGAW